MLSFVGLPVYASNCISYKKLHQSWSPPMVLVVGKTCFFFLFSVTGFYAYSVSRVITTTCRQFEAQKNDLIPCSVDLL